MCSEGEVMWSTGERCGVKEMLCAGQEAGVECIE